MDERDARPRQRGYASGVRISVRARERERGRVSIPPDGCRLGNMTRSGLKELRLNVSPLRCPRPEVRRAPSKYARGCMGYGCVTKSGVLISDQWSAHKSNRREAEMREMGSCHATVVVDSNWGGREYFWWSRFRCFGSPSHPHQPPS